MTGERGRPPAPLVLTIVGLGAFITALDQTGVVTAFPSVMLDLKIPFTQLDRASWIITSYLLGYTVAMPLIGRLGDVYGYARVYKSALIVFAVGTSLVAMSSSLEWMVGARVVQAVGRGRHGTHRHGYSQQSVAQTSAGAGFGYCGSVGGGGVHVGPGLRRSDR